MRSASARSQHGKRTAGARLPAGAGITKLDQHVPAGPKGEPEGDGGERMIYLRLLSYLIAFGFVVVVVLATSARNR